MDLSYTYLLILLEILFTNGEDASKKKCQRIPNTGVIEYLCPSSNVGIHVDMNLIMIQCNATKVLDVTVLPKENFNNVTKLELVKCPLPENGLQDIVDRFNITNLKQLSFTLAISTNYTLKEKELMHLIGLQKLELFEVQIKEDGALNNLINLMELHLKGNKLKQISRRVLSDCKNIEKINIERNPNLILLDDVFSKFANLRTVHLTFDQLENIPETLFNGSTNLRVIRLDHNRLKSLHENVFEGLKNLEELDLNDNEIQVLPAEIFSSLNNLKQLHLQHNHIRQIETELDNLQNLNIFNISYNNLNKFDITSSSMKSYTLKRFMHLRKVDLSYNHLTTYPYILNSRLKMESINLQNNSIGEIELITLLSNNRIKLKINLDSNNISSIIISDKDLQETDRIETKTTVSISNNPITCDCESLNLARFLQQSHNLSKYITFDSQVECSGPEKGETKNLKDFALGDLTCALNRSCTKNGYCDCLKRSFDDSLIVNCSNRELTEIPVLNLVELSKFKQTEVHLENNRLSRSPGKLDGYTNIAKLYLQGNEITNVTWTSPSLKVLNLSNNALSSLNDEFLRLLNESSIENLSLGSNPWKCDCGAVNFAEYIKEHIGLIDSSDIRCENTNYKLLNLHKKYLCRSNTVLILLSSLSILTLFILAAIATSFYYKFKKEILIWLYSRGLCLCLVKEDEIDEDKKYDAFISYSHKDEEFVTDNIVSILESGEKPYKLCIHVRDFTPGELIYSQMIDAIRTSRRTIVVLSPSFLESVWGKLEFKTAHTEALLEGRSRVIVIICGDIDLKALDDELKNYIKTNTYVQWGDPWFWMKLRYALPKKNRKSVITSQKHVNMTEFINNKFHVKRESTLYSNQFWIR